MQWSCWLLFWFLLFIIIIILVFRILCFWHIIFDSISDFLKHIYVNRYLQEREAQKFMNLKGYFLDLLHDLKWHQSLGMYSGLFPTNFQSKRSLIKIYLSFVLQAEIALDYMLMNTVETHACKERNFILWCCSIWSRKEKTVHKW